MTSSSKFTFRVPPRNIAAMKASLFSLLALTGLSFALPFIPTPEPQDAPRGMILVAAIGVVIFGGLALATYRGLKRLPRSAISLDTEGLWYAHLKRDRALIPWDRVHTVSEGGFTQALKLYDQDGTRLMRVEYQLNGFEKLRDILYDHVSEQLPALEFPSTYSKNRGYHLLYGTALAILILACLTAALLGGSMLGAIILAIVTAMLAFDYLWSAYSLTVHEQHLEIHYPLSTHRLTYTNIDSVDMTGSFHRGYRQPEIRIIAKSGEPPHKLKRLGIDTNVLYRLLKTTRVQTR